LWIVSPEIAAPEGKVLVYDGVSIVRRGDVMLMCYQQAARLHRTKWLFDVVDDVLSRIPGSIVAFLVVLPSADPPDGVTRRENTARLDKIGGRVRRLVTVPVGDAFRVSVVRAVMRGLNVVLGYSQSRFVANSLESGFSVLLETASPKTPSRPQLMADIARLYEALGEEPPTYTETRAAAP
jgi:hypothetical protein